MTSGNTLQDHTGLLKPDAGKDLLTFLSLNEVTVCNSLLSKQDIHKQTWQHPKLKRWHCIDFAIVCQRDHMPGCISQAGSGMPYRSPSAQNQNEDDQSVEPPITTTWRIKEV